MEFIVNPGRKRKRRRSTRARARRRRSSYRRNPSSPRRRRRRGYRRNPGVSLRGLPIGKIALGAVGGLGTIMAVNAIGNALPAQYQGREMKLAVKAGVVIAAAMLLPRFVGRETGLALATGAGTIVAADALREYLAPHVPGLADLVESPYQAVGVGDYLVQTGMSGYGEGKGVWES